MSLEKHFPFLGLVSLLLTACVLIVFDVPVEPTWGAIFIGIVLLYITWLTAFKVRDPDEVKSAALKFSMNFGASMGLATALMAVALMLAMPGLADFIARIAMDARDGISPAGAGFGLGVMFTVAGAVVFSFVGYTGWWLVLR
ncbi:hypothetical protein OAG56_03470 [Mariniblastus sp.]|nr:hypothetical protein [Mariniblastus sp.]MDB4756407.1 hypothetical protein [Mariniblastus sp.]